MKIQRIINTMIMIRKIIVNITVHPLSGGFFLLDHLPFGIEQLKHNRYTIAFENYNFFSVIRRESNGNSYEY